METTVQRLEKSQIRLTVSIPSDDVEQAFNAVIEDAVKNVEVKGFRKGKAPRAEVEKRLDSGELNGQAINRLLPKAYREAIEKEKLQPICDPRIEIKKFARGNELVFDALVAEMPEINLGNWRKALSDLNQKSKIATAATLTEAKNKAGSKDENPKVTAAEALQALRKASQFEVPEMLIEDEVGRMLTRLHDRLATLNLTPEEYLKNRGQTSEMLHQEYHDTAKELLAGELILDKLGEELKINVGDDEVEKTIAAAPDEASRKSLNTPVSRNYIKTILRKSRTVEEILKIAEGKIESRIVN